MIISVDIPTLIDTAKDKEVLDSIWLTLKASFAATLFTIIFGVPLAYVLARYSFPGKEIIEGIKPWDDKRLKSFEKMLKGKK